MTDAKAQLEKDLQNQIYLNQNLLRISRERANASRSITPKKIHTGYLVLSSRQWIEHYPHDLSPEEYQAMPIPLNKLIPFHVQNTVLHMYGNPSCRLLILPVFRFPAYRLALKKMICGKLVSWIFLAVLR